MVRRDASRWPVSNPLDPLMADIIARIEAGVPPWRQPWVGGADPSLPLRADGQPFSGTNLWLLSYIGALRSHTSPYWFTFKQALAIGACVRRGEKGTPAILYKTRIVSAEGYGSVVSDGAEDTRILRYLRGYAVFGAEQLDSCPEAYLSAPVVDPLVRAAARDAVLDAVPAMVEIGGGAACYLAARDIIRMPPPEAFDSVDDFKATLAHEQVHWTSAPSRLDRRLGRRHGDAEYAFEELVAEIGACLLGLRIGLRPQLLDSHASYLAHWIKLIRDRPSALLEASGQAQRAVDYLLAYSQPDAADTRQAA